MTRPSIHSGGGYQNSVPSEALALKHLLAAALDGDLDIVKETMGQCDPSDRNSQALRWAAMSGHVDIVRCLLPVSDPRAENNDAIMRAAANGHSGVVEVLLPGIVPEDGPIVFRAAAKEGWVDLARRLVVFMNPLEDCTPLLREAVKKDRLEIVELILPYCVSSWDTARALHLAAIKGSVAMVSLILSVSDALPHESTALFSAVLAGHETVVELLVPHSDPLRVWKNLLKENHRAKADLLSRYVPFSWVEEALKEADEGSMPQAQTLVLERALKATLADPVEAEWPRKGRRL